MVQFAEDFIEKRLGVGIVQDMGNSIGHGSDFGEMMVRMSAS